MIAVDTNILVYAHRPEADDHSAARQAMAGLAGGASRWGLPWPCVHEFLNVVTHPRVYAEPTPGPVAVDVIKHLLDAGGATPLGESRDHLRLLGNMLVAGRVVGPKVHDARVAAICLGHGVTELWTADRDFSYFPQLRTRNPLVA